MPSNDMKPTAVEATMQKIKRQRRQRLATRTFLVVVLALLLVACFVGASVWLYRVFYRDNPHFIFRELTLEETLHFNQKKVLQILEGSADYPCVLGKTSLLNLDLGRLRAELLNDPMVKDVELRRIMPDTLEIAIKERVAIATIGPEGVIGALVDENGILFPYNGKEGLDFPMPFITKVDGVDSLQKGVPVDDIGVNCAVELINEISKRKKIDRAGYAIYGVRLNYERERLEAMLRPLTDNVVIPKGKGAFVLIPMDKDKMFEALGRLDAILKRKVDDKETLSFADVTLQFNVPTRD